MRSLNNAPRTQASTVLPLEAGEKITRRYRGRTDGRSAGDGTIYYTNRRLCFRPDNVRGILNIPYDYLMLWYRFEGSIEVVCAIPEENMTVEIPPDYPDWDPYAIRGRKYSGDCKSFNVKIEIESKINGEPVTTWEASKALFYQYTKHHGCGMMGAGFWTDPSGMHNLYFDTADDESGPMDAADDDISMHIGKVMKRIQEEQYAFLKCAEEGRSGRHTTSPPVDSLTGKQVQCTLGSRIWFDTQDSYVTRYEGWNEDNMLDKNYIRVCEPGNMARWVNEQFRPGGAAIRNSEKHLAEWRESVRNAEKRDCECLDCRIEPHNLFEGGNKKDYLKFLEKDIKVRIRMYELMRKRAKKKMFKDMIELKTYEGELYRRLSKAFHKNGKNISKYSPQIPAEYATNTHLAEKKVDELESMIEEPI